jgi:hypothetical protein
LIKPSVEASRVSLNGSGKTLRRAVEQREALVLVGADGFTYEHAGPR